MNMLPNCLKIVDNHVVLHAFTQVRSMYLLSSTGIIGPGQGPPLKCIPLYIVMTLFVLLLLSIFYF